MSDELAVVPSAADDNVSQLSRASETYHEVKDLLHGIIRTNNVTSSH